jgi:hypothetical protein
MALQLFIGCWHLQFHNLFYRDGRTPSTSDQPVARPLPTHRTTQTQNKHTHPYFEWDSNPRSQCSSRDSLCLTPRGHNDRHNEVLTHSWSWALLEKLPIVQLLENFPAFYGTRRFIIAFTWALHRSLFWARSIQSMPSHPTSLRSILIFSTHLCLGLPSGLTNSNSAMSNDLLIENKKLEENEGRNRRIF